MINNQTELKGILPVNKPTSWTSFDVCNKLKHLLKTSKIGHLGTLDPMASGVLLVTVGKATKLFDLFQEKHKTYVAKFKFGYSTDTLDATGTTLSENGKIPTESEIAKALPKFIGEISQIPPQYSAKSVNGKRAYDLARVGKTVDLKPCKVKIFNLEVIAYQNAELTLKIECGSGTYIRALGRDIATELGTFATMTELTRAQVGNFTLEQCINQNMFDENVGKNLVCIKDALKLPVLNLNEVEKGKLLNGQIIKTEQNDGYYHVLGKTDSIAIAKISNFNAKMCIFLGL